MKLNKRFKNRFVMKPILDGKHHYRADYTARDFRSSCIATLARLEKYKYERA
ncbi:hypothetical protein RG475_003001 [Elizabethkingia anophelis]|nr:hypothetical protein [Elizabethkingia anophelis]ELB1894356.1 hypothetical protein [Elizabethkingia anophelis]